jgi:hypothetical protein
MTNANLDLLFELDVGMIDAALLEHEIAEPEKGRFLFEVPIRYFALFTPAIEMLRAVACNGD